MKKSYDKTFKLVSCIVIIILCIFFICSCSNVRANRRLKDYEKEFNIELPNDYKLVLYKSITSIDGENCYIVIKYEGDYKLNYENQLYTEYANYDSFDVFKKIDLAKYYFSNIVKDKNYFVNELDNYDWYGYEYVKISGEKVSVTRYVDLYVLQDLDNNLLYIFYDKHQYPYDEQR